MRKDVKVLVSHVIGTSKDYDPENFKNCIYFAEDTKSIFMNGIEYGGSNNIEEPDKSTVTITCNYVYESNVIYSYNFVVPKGKRGILVNEEDIIEIDDIEYITLNGSGIISFDEDKSFEVKVDLVKSLGDDWHIMMKVNTGHYFGFIDGSEFENNKPCHMMIDWGDGVLKEYKGSEKTTFDHSYKEASEKEIKIKILNPEDYNYEQERFADELPTSSPILILNPSLNIKVIKELHYKPLTVIMTEDSNNISEIEDNERIWKVFESSPYIENDFKSKQESDTKIRADIIYNYLIIIFPEIGKLALHKSDFVAHSIKYSGINNLYYDVRYGYDFLNTPIYNYPEFGDNVFALLDGIFQNLEYEHEAITKVYDEDLNEEEMIKLLYKYYEEDYNKLEIKLPSNLAILSDNIFSHNVFLFGKLNLPDSLVFLGNSFENNALMDYVELPSNLIEASSNCLEAPTLKELRLTSDQKEKFYDLINEEYTKYVITDK